MPTKKKKIRSTANLIDTTPKPGMKRYGFRNYNPELVHELRKIIDDLRESVERYLIVCDTMKWKKMYPLSKTVRRFYIKYQLHFLAVAISMVDDGVQNGFIDPNTYVESATGINNAKKFRAIKDKLWPQK